MPNLKITFHCLIYTDFRKCKIKFYPTADKVFTESYMENDVFVLANPVQCKRPIFKALF